MIDMNPTGGHDTARIEGVAQAMSDVIRVMRAHKALRGSGVAGLDPAGAALLIAIGERQVRISDLAHDVATDVSTISRQVSGLAEAGLVDKLPDPSDRRVAIVELTESGRRTTDELRRVHFGWFADLFSDWSDADLEQFQAFLRRLVRAVSCELGARASSLAQ